MVGAREERVEIGYVARPHGVRGELRIVTHDPDCTALLDASRVFVGEDWYTIDKARRVNDAVLLVLDGIGDRDRAAALKGSAVEVVRTELSLDVDDVLLADLVGCVLVLESGQEWGHVHAVDAGLQDRLVVHHEGVERLLPVVDAFILDIDLESGRIVVDPPEGLPETPVRGQS